MVIHPSYYVEHMHFGWSVMPHLQFSEELIRSAPRPRIALITSADKWQSFDRTGMDAVIYWTSEGLGDERTDGRPIVPLGPNDMVFSSSSGPNSTINLNFWFHYFTHVHAPNRMRRFFPNPSINENKLFCALGHGRLARCYVWCKLMENELVNNNPVSFVSNNFYWSVQQDATNELSGQERMSHYVRNNWNIVPKSPVRLDDDWRWMRLQDHWRGLTRSGFNASLIIPTRAVERSSLLFVPETLLHDREFFLTEKTVKALISGRPSIIIGCQNNLELIKDMGFMTWNGLIDERYQKLIGPKSRIDAAISEARRFIDWNILNHPGALKEAERIAQHNLQHLLSTDWTANIRLAVRTAKEKLGID